VYLNPNSHTPVAVLTQTRTGTSPSFVWATSAQYAYSDQIDTVRAITRPSDNKLRWRSDNADPFYMSAPNTNPQALGAFIYHPRFPGQVYDQESNLHYNWHRDYDPKAGRYVQSDPIGLAGGLNTYSYVYGNPTGLVDRDGKIPGLAGAAAGAAFNFGLQFGSNLIGNGYNVENALRCVDFKKVGTAALLGFFLPGAFATGRSFGTEVVPQIRTVH
jgi:RHS repeat-associated protein